MPVKPSEKPGLLVQGEPLGVDYLHTQSHVMLFRDGKTREQVIRTLVDEGAEPGLAREVVKYQLQQFYQKRKAQGRKETFQGLLWFGGGATLAFFGVCFFSWGPMIYGGWAIVSGLSKLV